MPGGGAGFIVMSRSCNERGRALAGSSQRVPEGVGSLKAKNRLLAAAVLAAVAASGGEAARASTLLTTVLTNSYQSGNSCSNCGPFGTVTVSSMSNPDEVQITLTLEPNEVFNIAGGTGAGKPLLFDISGDPTNMTMQMVTLPTGTQASWFSLSETHQMVMADGTGIWSDAIVCGGCATGTSGNYSGTLSFYLTATTPLTASSFVANTPNGNKGGGLYFGSDIGLNSLTGDVAAPSVTAVPLPAAGWLFFSALGGLGLLQARRKSAAS